MCARDPLFYINTFVWIFEPRTPARLPFITYRFQDRSLETLFETIGVEDMVIEKSRDMGASWMCITAFEWFWHFSEEMYTFLLLSRKADLVEKRGDPKSLYWKLDFIHQHQPGWIKPAIESRQMHRSNTDSGSTIDGDSTTEFSGVADRRTAILLDEFSKMDGQEVIFTGTRDATDSRIFNFTPQGSGNLAYEIANDPDRKKLTLHWSEHPLKARGLYEYRDGQLSLLDKSYWTKTQQQVYPFVLTQPNNPKYAFRSPWYDGEEKRAHHPKELAQELDIDYLGSDYNYFDAPTIRRLIQEHTRPPDVKGMIEYNSAGEFIGFNRNPKGMLYLWLRPGPEGEMPRDRTYSVGVDVAAGTGASNSAVCIGDSTSGEQVGEFAVADWRPEELARFCVALCRWLFDAKLIWEAPGPGREFGSMVLELGYRNIYYREPDRKKIIKTGVSYVPGWYPTKDSRLEVIGEYRRAVTDGEFKVRSAEQLEECRYFVYTKTGWVLHSGYSSSLDPTGAKENHGDRPTAGALCWHIMEPAPTQPSMRSRLIPYGSIAWRHREMERRQKLLERW
jgi:hypothetical protein